MESDMQINIVLDFGARAEACIGREHAMIDIRGSKRSTFDTKHVLRWKFFKSSVA
jgi:hypothetical protein